MNNKDIRDLFIMFFGLLSGYLIFILTYFSTTPNSDESLATYIFVYMGISAFSLIHILITYNFADRVLSLKELRHNKIFIFISTFMVSLLTISLENFHYSLSSLLTGDNYFAYLIWIFIQSIEYFIIVLILAFIYDEYIKKLINT